MCFGKRLMTKYIPKKVDNKNDKIKVQMEKIKNNQN